MTPRSAFAGFMLAACLLCSCKNPMRDTIGKVVATYNRAAVAAYPVYNTLASDTSIEVEFSKEMNPDTLKLGGSLGEKASAEWAKISTTGAHDFTKLWLVPASGSWPSDGLQLLVLSCTDTDGFVTAALTRSYGVLADAIYVSEAGRDNNPGTAAYPLRSIALAETRIQDIGLNWTKTPIAAIKVAQGSYPEHGVMHFDSLILDGGWKPDWSAQDSAAYPSVLEPVSGNLDSTVQYAIATYGTASGTRIQHLTIKLSGIGRLFYAVWLIDSSAELRDLNIAISGCAGPCGIVGEGTGDPLVSGSTLSIENSTGTSIAIAAMLDSDRTLTLKGSSILSSGTRIFEGVAMVGGQGILDGNTIKAGDDETSGTVYGVIISHGAEALLRNSVIDARGTTPKTCSPVACQGGTATLQNDTIVSCRFGVIAAKRGLVSMTNNLLIYRASISSPADDGAGYFERTSDAMPIIFRNNRCSNYDRVYLDVQASTNSVYWPPSDIAGLEAHLVAANCLASGNTATESDESPYFHIGTWDLQSAAPAAITAGGLDLSADFTTDLAGRPRAAGLWSVGAYQKP
jgi:hypothetical protein